MSHRSSRLQIRPVSIDAIDLSDVTYKLTPGPAAAPAPSLRHSVRRVGILHPPLLREKADHRYQVVNGRQRLLLAREISASTPCPCRVLASSFTATEIFDILLEELLTCRPLTVVEQAMFLEKVTSFLDREETARRYLPSMGRSAHPTQIDRLLELLQLEETLLASLHAGQLDEAVARSMVTLTPDDRGRLLEIITTLKLGAGKQKKLVSSCRELAIRQGIFIVDLLGNDEVKHILEHQDANPPQQASRLMTWLSRMSSPRLAVAEQAFRRLTDSLRLPPSVSLAHVPAFEKDTLTLNVNLRNEDELHKVWAALRPLLQEAP